MRRAALVASLVVLVCAAALEGAIALGWLDIGDVPGEGAPGQSLATTAGLAALLVGGSVLLVAGRGSTPRPLPGAWLAPLAGAAFVLCLLASYDPYYAPALRRVGAGASPAVIVAIVVVALTCSAIAWLLAGRPLEGPTAGAPLLIALLALIGAGGH